MPKMFLLFSHKLTEQQIADAKESLGVEGFVRLPPKLQELWSDVPPDITDLALYLQPIQQWLKEQVQSEDFVLVQGDFGATCKFVTFVKEQGAKAVYATTKRNVEERLLDGKVVKTSVFEHIRFREYKA